MLGPKARALLANPANTILATVVSLWEITMKWRAGKYPLPGSAFAEFVETQNVELVGVSLDHLAALEKLPVHHKDPFDHLIIAQALVPACTEWKLFCFCEKLLCELHPFFLTLFLRCFGTWG